MKRFLAIYLTLCLLFLSSCNGNSNESTTDSESGSEATVSNGDEFVPDSGYEKAVYLIEKGDYKNAYFELCEIKDDPKANEMLKNFKIVPTNISKTTVYNQDGQKRIANYSYTYDEKGNIVKFSNDDRSYEFDYDEKGNLTKIVNGNENKTVEEYTYKYDSDGRTVEASSEDYVYKYEYNENGNVTKVIGAPADENDIYSIRYGQEYFYDDDGYLIKALPIAEANDDGAGAEYLELELDENKNIIKQKGNDYTCEYTYENGLLIKETIQRADATVITENTYDEDGNVITHNVIQNDEQLNLTLLFTYDENGLRIKAEDKTFTEEYTYDEDGNIIKIRKADFGSVNETAFSNYQYFYSAEKASSPFENKFQFFMEPLTSDLGWYDFTPEVKIEQLYT